MKKNFLTILIISLMLLGFNEIKAVEIAVVNIEEIAKNSLAINKLNKDLNQKKDNLQKKFRDTEIKLNAKRDDIASKSSILSQEAMQKKAMEFQQEVMEFQEEVKKEETNLQQELMEGLSVVNEQVEKIILEIKKEEQYKKYNFIINSASLLYFEEKDDISSEVLKRLNKKLPIIKNTK